MKGIYKTILLLVQITYVAPYLICLSCTDVVTPTDCETVEKCGPHSSCYLDLHATSTGELRYSVGCRDIMHCSGTKRRRQRYVEMMDDSIYTYPPSLAYKFLKGAFKHQLTNSSTDVDTTNFTEDSTNISKHRRDKRLVCSMCCNNGNLCNSKGCSHGGYSTNHGPICYNCAQQSNTSNCNRIKECGRDEMCYIEELTIADITLYHTKCMEKMTCSDLKIILTTAAVTSPSIVGRHVRIPHEVSIGDTVVKERYTKATRECCGPSLCNTYLPQNGNWEPWMSWSGCSASCGFHGFQTRTRSCAYPPPNLGGLSCEGPDSEIDYTCANKPCHHGTICLSCDSSLYPRTCNYVETCGPNSVCYLERYITRNGDSNYRTGCRDVNHCSNGVRVGKRFLANGDILSCTECCHGNLCNSHGCGTPPHPSDSGPICFSCDQQGDTEHCHKIDVCKKGQVCGLKMLSTVDTVYQTMCLDPVQCLSHSVGDKIYPKCCTSSLCVFSNNYTHGDTLQPSAVKQTTRALCTPPTITSIQKNGEIKVNTYISLTCHISGIPTPSVTWMVFKNREDAVDVYGNFISIGPLDEHMIGAYKCVAKNNCGTVEQNFTITHIGTR